MTTVSGKPAVHVLAQSWDPEVLDVAKQYARISATGQALVKSMLDYAARIDARFGERSV